MRFLQIYYLYLLYEIGVKVRFIHKIETTMKRIYLLVGMLAQLVLMSGCAAAWQGTTYVDDLYSIHNKTAIANRQKAEAELAKAQYEAQQAQYEAALAKVNADAAKYGYTVTENAVNGYDAVLADTYESAYARRLYGFSSPTYRMPSSYYTWRYSDAFHYVSAYDPALYNVMVSGDMVWVEPKYITSMFGSWGAVAVPAYSWYYGWGYPYYGWNAPYYNWYWGYPYRSHYYCYHHHHHPYRPYHKPPYHRPSYHKPSNPRPPQAGPGGVGNSGHQHNRPGMVVGRNPGASQPVDRGQAVRPSQPSNGRVTTPTYRGGSSSSKNNGSSSYRSGGSSSSGSSSYRSSGSSGSSYSGGSSRSSSYSGGSSHSSGGGSHSSGNSRGR